MVIQEDQGPTLFCEEGIDLPRFDLSTADHHLWKTYGDLLHRNDGIHQDSSIANDRRWQQ
eukprot:3294750-Ditylum_brightwellii.AAC.1